LVVLGLQTQAVAPAAAVAALVDGRESARWNAPCC